MNSILFEQINGTCVVSRDDILVYSTSLEEHICKFLKINFQNLKESQIENSVRQKRFSEEKDEVFRSFADQ